MHLSIADKAKQIDGNSTLNYYNGILCNISLMNYLHTHTLTLPHTHTATHKHTCYIDKCIYEWMYLYMCIDVLHILVLYRNCNTIFNTRWLIIDRLIAHSHTHTQNHILASPTQPHIHRKTHTHTHTHTSQRPHTPKHKNKYA